MRRLCIPIALVLAAALLAACGTETVSVSSDDAAVSEGAELFATHCAGCHTMTPAGTQGSGNRALRVQGPNFDQRKETYDEVLFAIHNGGASGAIMPQNIVVGDDAEKVAKFVAAYAGTEVEEPPRPAPAERSDKDGSSDGAGMAGKPGGGSAAGGSADATQGGSAGSGSQSDSD